MFREPNGGQTHLMGGKEADTVLPRGRGDIDGKGELGLFILWPFPRTNGWDV